MHYKKIHLMLISGLVILMLLVTTISFATGPCYETSTEAKMSRKLLRGLMNIPFSLVEIPLEINTQVRCLDPFTGFWVGLGKGAAKTWKRAVAGVWEVLTFPIEIPKGYRPVVEPEFPMMDVID